MEWGLVMTAIYLFGSLILLVSGLNQEDTRVMPLETEAYEKPAQERKFKKAA